MIPLSNTRSSKNDSVVLSVLEVDLVVGVDLPRGCERTSAVQVEDVVDLIVRAQKVVFLGVVLRYAGKGEGQVEGAGERANSV